MSMWRMGLLAVLFLGIATFLFPKTVINAIDPNGYTENEYACFGFYAKEIVHDVAIITCYGSPYPVAWTQK